MSTPRDSLPEPLRAQIEAAALQFAEQIVGAFEKSIEDVTVRLAAQSSSEPAQRPAAVPARANKRTQGGAAQGRLERRIETALKKSESGLGVEQLNRTLGTTTPVLTPALQSLMEKSRIGKRGKARGTKYYLL